MADLQSLPLEELEALCDKGMLDLYRSFHKDDPSAYRNAIIEFLNQPRLPIPGILSAVRANPAPADAWRELLSVCRTAAPTALWDLLRPPEVEGDIKATRFWLGDQLTRLPHATGIYLGLDTLNMRRGRGANVEIGGSAACDPASDSQDWVFGKLERGARHLIHGLYELRAEYSAPAWRVEDERVAQGSYFGFADYTLFLGYSGIVLGHAFARLPSWPKLKNRTLLAVWGFHDGDLFLLGRMTLAGFTVLCR